MTYSNVRNVLAASIASLLFGPAAMAEIPPSGAIPITTAATVGNEQSDFHYVKGALDHKGDETNFIVFSSSTGLAKKTVKGVTSFVSDDRVIFSQEVNSGAGAPNFTVTKAGPLKKLTTLAVPLPAPILDPKGSTLPADPELTPLDGFAYNTDLSSINLDERAHLPSQLFFHAPGKGIYVIKNGSAIGVVRAETLAAPTIPGALKNPGNRTDNTDSGKTLQARYVFGARVPTKNKLGYEPFLSAGGVATELDDVEAGKNLGSNPYDFTTFGDVDGGTSYKTVYFLTDPDNGAMTTPSLWRLTVEDVRNKLTYSATQIAAQTNLTSPHLATGPVFPSPTDPAFPHLASDSAFLFLSKKANSADAFNSLYVSQDIRDISNAMVIFGDDRVPLRSGGKVEDASDFLIKPLTEEATAFVSTDSATGRRLFTSFFATPGEAAFTDETKTITDPTNLASTGDGEEFFYIGTHSGTRYALGDDTLTSGNQSNLTGGASPFALTDQSGTLLTNVKELVIIDDIVFVVADGKVNGNLTTDVLWKYDSGNLEDGDFKADAVHSETGGGPVVGAHNLSGFVEDNGVGDHRLYFTAPIDSTHNAQYRPLDRKKNPLDVGTKPWVYVF